MVDEYLNTFDKILCDMADEMFIQKIEKNIINNYIHCTISHHKASILMCENILNYTENNDIRNLAYDIIEFQKETIHKLKQNMEDSVEQALEIESYMIEYRKIITTMIFKMYDSPKCKNFDINFIGEITPHFEAVILMSQNVLNYTDKKIELIEEIIKESKTNLEKLDKIKEEIID